MSPVANVVGHCKDCGEPMISQPDYRRKPELRELYVRVNGADMCNTCYVRAWRHGTLPDPAPRAQSARNNAPLCWVERTYAARCAVHGEVGRGATRAEAEAIGARHAKARHDGSVRRPSTAKALDGATLSRLRADVGFEVAS